MKTKFKKNKIVAFIPLRKRSKSIRFKNIRKVAGKPLAFWVIEAALKCSLINRVVVSSNSSLIRNKIKEIKNKKLEVIKRSEETATDTASSESALLEFAKADHDFNNIILIQATSPLLETIHLKQGIEKYFKYKCDSLLSVVRQKRFVWEEKNKQAKPVNYNPLKRPLRQNFQGFLVENGAFYITSRERLLKTKCRISGKMSVYEMPEASYFELDELADLIIIKKLLEKRNND